MVSKLFNSDAEVAILSILIKNPELIYEVNSLKGFMFSSTPNTILFDSITNLATQGLVPDIHLLSESLKSNKTLDLAGGEDYLDYLSKQVFDEQNYPEYLNLIEDSYKARNLLSMAAKIPSIVEGTTNISSVISQLRSSIDSLTENFGGDGTCLLADVLQDTWREIKNRIDNPGISGVPTGFSSLDAVTGGYQKGDVVIYASRPSVGKTASLCNSVLSNSKKGIKSLIFEHEMNKQSIVERLIAIECSIPAINIRMGNLVDEDLERINEALILFKSLPIFIDTNFGADINYVISTTKKYHKTHKIDLIYVDYLQLLVKRDENMTHALGEASRGIKSMSNQLGITSILYSQLNRAVESRDNKRPTLADLRQSGNLEEDADIVIMLYRDEMYNENTQDKGIMEFIIRKHRNGPLGKFMVKFTKETNRMGV